MIHNRGVLRIGRRMLIPTEAHDSFNAVSRNCAEVVADEFSLRYDFTSNQVVEGFSPSSFRTCSAHNNLGHAIFA